MLDHMVRACLVLEETAKLSSRKTVPFSTPSSDEREALWLVLLTASDVSGILDIDCSNRGVIVPHCGSNLQFPNDI